MDKPLLIYIAAPYINDNVAVIVENIHRAKTAGQEIMRRGHYVICPHTMTALWNVGTDLVQADFIRQDLVLLEKCDAICLLPGWEKSDGAKHEYDVAKSLNMTTFFGVEDIPEVTP